MTARTSLLALSKRNTCHALDAHNWIIFCGRSELHWPEQSVRRSALRPWGGSAGLGCGSGSAAWCGSQGSSQRPASRDSLEITTLPEVESGPGHWNCPA